MKRIAVLGTGAMGFRLAQNLLNANYEVIAYNRTIEKIKPLLNQGAVQAATPREAVEQADIAISMVADNEASRAIWLDPKIGAVLGLRRKAIAIESSTLTIDWIEELALEVENCGAAFLDAPVVGSLRQAEARKLIYLVGGSGKILAQARNVLLGAGAATTYHLGAVGRGMAMKLAVNALFGIQVAALAEVLGMLSKNGIELSSALECLGNLPVTSPAAKGAGSLMLAGDRPPMFPIKLVEKDFRYIAQTAQAVNASTPTSAAAHSVYLDAIANGYGSDNITGVAQLFI